MYELEEGKVTQRIKKNIPYRRLQWIHQLMNLPYEVGGSIRFDKNKKFVGFTLWTPGKENYEITIPDALDCEYHTHPLREMVQFPSLTDLMAQAKRSVNENKACKSKKFKQYRGPIAIVFNRLGAVIYGYKKCTLPSRKEQKKMIKDIVALSAPAGGMDTMEILSKQAEIARKYGFRICLQSWEKIKKNGMRLVFERRRYYIKASNTNNIRRKSRRRRSRSRRRRR